MQKQELLRNAALIDQQKIREQLRSREETLKNENAAARASNDAELLGVRAGGTSQRTHAGVASRSATASARRMRTFSLSIRPGISVRIFYRQALAQNAQYLSERLKEQEAFYAESDAQRADWAERAAGGIQ